MMRALADEDADLPGGHVVDDVPTVAVGDDPERGSDDADLGLGDGAVVAFFRHAPADRSALRLGRRDGDKGEGERS